MKKAKSIITILMVALMLFTGVPAKAQNAEIARAVKANVNVFINNKQIPCYSISGNRFVLVNHLINYGFDLTVSAPNNSVIINRNLNKGVSGLGKASFQYAKSYAVTASDRSAFTFNRKLPTLTIGGCDAIFLAELYIYGTVKVSADKKNVYLTLSNMRFNNPAGLSVVKNGIINTSKSNITNVSVVHIAYCKEEGTLITFEDNTENIYFYGLGQRNFNDIGLLDYEDYQYTYFGTVIGSWTTDDGRITYNPNYEYDINSFVSEGCKARYNFIDSLTDKYNAAAEKRIEAALAKEYARIAKYNTGITYDSIARYPEWRNGQKVMFEGEVLQTIENGATMEIRFAVNGDYEQMIYCSFNKSIVGIRILEGDYIRIYGTAKGLYSYTAVSDKLITLPYVSVEMIDIG